jgi:hypothetical protein
MSGWPNNGNSQYALYVHKQSGLVHAVPLSAGIWGVLHCAGKALVGAGVMPCGVPRARAQPLPGP